MIEILCGFLLLTSVVSLVYWRIAATACEKARVECTNLKNHHEVRTHYLTAYIQEKKTMHENLFLDFKMLSDVLAQTKKDVAWYRDKCNYLEQKLKDSNINPEV